MSGFCYLLCSGVKKKAKRGKEHTCAVLKNKDRPRGGPSVNAARFKAQLLPCSSSTIYSSSSVLHKHVFLICVVEVVYLLAALFFSSPPSSVCAVRSYK